MKTKKIQEIWQRIENIIKNGDMKITRSRTEYGKSNLRLWIATSYRIHSIFFVLRFCFNGEETETIMIDFCENWLVKKGLFPLKSNKRTVEL